MLAPPIPIPAPIITIPILTPLLQNATVGTRIVRTIATVVHERIEAFEGGLKKALQRRAPSPGKGRFRRRRIRVVRVADGVGMG